MISAIRCRQSASESCGPETNVPLTFVEYQPDTTPSRSASSVLTWRGERFCIWLLSVWRIAGSHLQERRFAVRQVPPESRLGFGIALRPFPANSYRFLPRSPHLIAQAAVARSTSRNRHGCPRNSCDKLTRRANQFGFAESCQAPESKIFCFTELANQVHNPLRSGPTRGALRGRHETLGAGCDGCCGVRRVFSRRAKRSRRTAKSCGPGAATLASSCW